MTDSTGALIEAAARRLETSGSTSARLDAQLLLGMATGRARTELLAHPERGVSAGQHAAFQALVARREASEPVAYLLGEREFYGRTFGVDRRALIPRPETELLVDLGRAAVTRFRAEDIEPIVIDIGTGCGAIAISLAAESHISLFATDVSLDALTLTRENAVLHSVSSAVRLVQTDLVGGLRGPLHVVLANLPYIPDERELPPEVKDYEPNVALFGGVEGTELLRKFLRETRPLLAPRAEVCVELDEEEQATPVAGVARELYAGADVTVCQDAGGYDRVVRILLT